MARNTIRILNDQIARQAAIRNYAQWYEYHAEAEQMAVEAGAYELAEAHHGSVLVLLKALDGEQHKPEGLA